MFQGFQRRPDSSKLPHPPPSLANCGTAETGEIFRAVWRGFTGSGGTRDALEGRNGPHFRYSSLIPIFEGHVCAPNKRRALTGPYGSEKEATREAGIEAGATRSVAGLAHSVQVRGVVAFAAAVVPFDREPVLIVRTYGPWPCRKHRH